MQTPLKHITHLFPVWALLLSAIAFYFPAPFAALKPGIIALLAVIMLGMGMTLTLADFKRVGQQPVFSENPFGVHLEQLRLRLQPSFSSACVVSF